MRKQLPALDLRAAYVGAANGDDPPFFAIFEAAMHSIGITDRRHISSHYRPEEAAYLRSADIILLAGGDADLGWRAMNRTVMASDVRDSYFSGTVLLGVSAGAVLLGVGIDQSRDPNSTAEHGALSLVPYLIRVHDEQQDWKQFRADILCASEGTRGLGISTGGGIICHPNNELQPVRRTIVELCRCADSVAEHLLVPRPPTGP